MNYFSFYAQDTWQLKPRFTHERRFALGAGTSVRGLPPARSQRLELSISNRYRQGLRSKMFVNAPPGFVYSGDPEIGAEQQWSGSGETTASCGRLTGRSSRRASVWHGMSKAMAEPLFALLTESILKSTERFTGSVLRNSSHPGVQAQRLLSPAGGLDDPWAGIPGGNPHPLTAHPDDAVCRRGATYQPNNPDLYSDLHSNVEFERATRSGDGHAAVGSLSRNPDHPPSVRDTTQSVRLRSWHRRCQRQLLPQWKPQSISRLLRVLPCSTAANTQDRRRLSLLRPQFRNEIGRLGIIVNGGTQNYHGMLMSFQKRARQWHHCNRELYSLPLHR